MTTLLHPCGARRVPASPLARRLLWEAGIPLVGLVGTGPGGRVVRRDVEALLADRNATPVTSSGR